MTTARHFRRHGKGTVTDYPVFSAAGENRHSNDKPVPALEKRFALHAITMHFFASSGIGSCNMLQLFFGACWIQGDELRHLCPRRLFLRTERTNTRKVNQSDSDAFRSERKTHQLKVITQIEREGEGERKRERERVEMLNTWPAKEENVWTCRVVCCTEKCIQWSGWHRGRLSQKDFTCRGRSAESQHRGQPGTCWLDPKPWNDWNADECRWMQNCCQFRCWSQLF